MVTRTRPSLSSAQYEPGPVPSDAADLPRYLNDEFLKVAAAIKLLSVGHIDPSYAPPDKPRDGDFRYAKAPWNPGSGDGVYLYNGTTNQWKFLG